MADTFWRLWNELDSTLRYTQSLVKGTRCVRENEEDLDTETELLSLAAEQVQRGRDLLNEMHKEYRRLEEQTKTA